jgi:DNA-directed RNA polymerase specialized sigma24 family protein
MPKSLALPDPLDIAYDHYWRHPRNRPPLDDLLAAVRSAANRITKDDDSTQDVILKVIQEIETFVRHAPDAFSRWIRRIAKIEQLKRRRQAGKDSRVDSVSDLDLAYTDAEDKYRDLSALTPYERDIVLELSTGSSVQDVAERRGVQVASLKRNIKRLSRNKPLNTLAS